MSGASSRHVCGIIWGMSGASSGACLGHNLGHVWVIVWGMSGVTSVATMDKNGQQSAVLHASVMPF